MKDVKYAIMLVTGFLLPLSGHAQPPPPQPKPPPPVSVAFSEEPKFTLRKGPLVRDIFDTSPVPAILGTQLKNTRAGTHKALGGEAAAAEEWTPVLSYGWTLTTPAKRLRAPTVYVVVLAQDANTAMSVWGAQLPGASVSGPPGTFERLDVQGMTLTNKLSDLSTQVDPLNPYFTAYDIAKLSPLRIDKFKLNSSGLDWTKAKILAWRLEVWHMGRFLTGYSRQNAERLKELNIPADWHTGDFGAVVSQ